MFHTRVIGAAVPRSRADTPLDLSPTPTFICWNVIANIRGLRDVEHCANGDASDTPPPFCYVKGVTAPALIKPARSERRRSHPTYVRWRDHREPRHRATPLGGASYSHLSPVVLPPSPPPNGAVFFDDAFARSRGATSSEIVADSARFVSDYSRGWIPTSVYPRYIWHLNGCYFYAVKNPSSKYLKFLAGFTSIHFLEITSHNFT